MQAELAQQVIKAMCRKFAGSTKVALRAYGHAVQAGDSEGARRALVRSLTSLQKRKHIKARSITSAGNQRCHRIVLCALPPAAACFLPAGSSTLTFPCTGTTA